MHSASDPKEMSPRPADSQDGPAALFAERSTRLETLEMPQLSLPNGGGALRGIDEKFTVNAANGTAGVSVPLGLSEGRDGFGPQLTLGYSSGGGNGAFGLGWALDLPAIRRRTDNGLPRYRGAEEDIFQYAGSEDLVPQLIEGPLGVWTINERVLGGLTVRRYLPRIAGDLARIERITNPAAETWWRVTDRADRTTIYGRTAASRIADPADPRRIAEWLPDLSYDQRGNWIRYRYRAEDGAGQPPVPAEANRRGAHLPSAARYLKRVRWANAQPWYPDPAAPFDPAFPADETCHFEAVFDYGEHDPAAPGPEAAPGRDWLWRGDAFSSFRTGFEVRIARLCRRVLMFHHFPDEALGTALVRSVDLTHASPDLAGAALVGAPALLVRVEKAGYLARTGGGYSRKALPPLDFAYAPIGWDMTRRELGTEALAGAPAGLTPPWRLVDLLGEGLAGILVESGGAWHWKASLGADPVTGTPRFERGRGFEVRPNLTGLASGEVTLQDLDGNGRRALVALAPQTGGFFAMDEAGAFQPFRAFPAVPTLDLRDPTLRRMDLTGDGRLSLVMAEDEALLWYPGKGSEGFGPAERVLRALDEDAGPVLVFAEAEQTIFLADMNGDGLSDLVRIRNGELSYWPNQGHGRFGRRVAMSGLGPMDAPDLFDPGLLRLADLTGTGTADLIYLGGGGARAWLNLSGNSFAPARPLPSLPPVDQLHSLEIADLTGRGTPVIAFSAMMPGRPEAALTCIDPMAGVKPHLLVSVTNNMGKETRLEWRASTADYLRDKAAGTPWATRLPFPVQVVARQTIHERISGARVSVEFTYHHGYWDAAEREFRGFGRTDRIDSESLDAFVDGGTGGPLLPRPEEFQPPVLTRTWYDTGAVMSEPALARAFADEAWPAAFDRAFPATALGHVEPALPPPRLVAAPTVLDPAALDRLFPEERAEAARARKSLVLRQEVFARDAGGPGATEAARRLEMLPYSVTTHAAHVQLLQPRGPNRYAVFRVVEDEGLEIGYERDPLDPRMRHSVNLVIDAQGNVLEQAAVTYGRNALAAAAALDAVASGASDMADQPEGPRLALALADALSRAEASQTRTRLTVTRNRMSNDIDLDAHWRPRLPTEVETFEVAGLFPAGRLFTRAELTGLLEDARSTEIAFETQPGPGITRRRIETSRTLYLNGDLTAALPFGQIAPHGVPHESYVRAFSPTLLAAAHGALLPAGPVLAALLAEGGYRQLPGSTDWWVPLGRQRFTDPGEGLADVQARYFKPLAQADAFGGEARIRYHKGYFLLIDRITDVLGNVTQVERFDFRTLGPTRLRDANDNLSEVVLDELGLVVALARLGKDLDGDGLAEVDLADNLVGQSGDGAADAATVAALLDATDSVQAEALARQLLRGASQRFVYDLGRFGAGKGPAVAATVSRTRNAVEDPAPELHLKFDYTDGAGGLAMTKVQAEPGPALAVTENPDGSLSLTTLDTGAQVPPRLRWVGSGRTILNNKGKPVRKYEPYFATTPGFESLPQMVAQGVSARLSYDALGRILRTDMPDGTFLSTRFSAWHVVNFDSGDTVLQSDWHARRVGRLIDAELLAQGRDPAREAEAAQAAAAFADTPTMILMDAQGRPILSLDHLGLDAAGKARLVPCSVILDIEGNLLEVRDARDNRALSFVHDLIGRRIAQDSMDGGPRHVVPDVAGAPLRKWDGRGHVLAFAYDALRRPVSQHLTGGDGPVPADHRVMQADYGEGAPGDRALNLRGQMIRRWDQGGLQEWRRFDAAGNALETRRRFAADYRNQPDWRGDLFAPLEAESHVTLYTFDAVNRVTSVTSPDGSVTRRFFSPANMLARVTVTPPGGAEATVVAGLVHDARGQRLELALGNGAVTRYRYDPLTFRLLGLHTEVAGTRVQDLAYTHDCAGNLTHREDRAIPDVWFANSHVTALARFAYDPLYRLIGAEGREHAGQTASFGAFDNWEDAGVTRINAAGDVMAWRSYTETYSHDPVGNLLTLSHVAPGGGSYTRSYAYEAGTNRLIATRIGADIYPVTHHPVHGLITAMPHLSLMAWNHRDELVATAQQAVAAGTPETTWYVYDHDGRRIRKVTDLAHAGAGQPQRKEERLYLGTFEIYRRHAGAEAGLERHSLTVEDDLGRIALIDRRNGVNDGTPLQVTRYQIANHLGSVALELDELGRLLSYEEFHPYGSSAYRARGGALPVSERRYRYTGMERDEESGLSYHGARYYAPWIGRWMKPDPAGLMDGINDYQFASGNPVRITDPSGMDGWDRFWGGVKMVGGGLEVAAGGALILAGAATSEFGVGIAIAGAGVLVAGHGADVTVSGARTMWEGEPVDTLTSSGLQELGMSRGGANLADAGISVVGSLGAGLVTRAPGAIAATEQVLANSDEAARVVATSGSEANSLSLAFKPGAPTGHNMVGITQDGVTVWSDLRVGSVTNLSGGSRIATPGTLATIATQEAPSAAYVISTVPVTAAEARAAMAFSTRLMENGGRAGTYSYLTNNCTTYATSVLRAGGVAAPPISPSVALVTTALQNPATVRTIAATGGAVNATVFAEQAVTELIGEANACEMPPDMEPPVAHSPAPASSTPASAGSAAPAHTPGPVSTPADEPMSSEYSTNSCDPQGYYDDEEQVCYAP